MGREAPKKKMSKAERAALNDIEAMGIPTARSVERMAAARQPSTEEADLAEARAMKAGGSTDDAILDHLVGKKSSPEVVARILAALDAMPTDKPRHSPVMQADEQQPVSSIPDVYGSDDASAHAEVQAGASEVASETQQQAGSEDAQPLPPKPTDEEVKRAADEATAARADLVRYIVTFRKAHASDAEIRKALRETGKTPKAIAEAFRIISSRDNRRARSRSEKLREASEAAAHEIESSQQERVSLGQIETRPGSAWIEEREAPPAGRERPAPLKIDEGPFIQVETKTQEIPPESAPETETSSENSPYAASETVEEEAAAPEASAGTLISESDAGIDASEAVNPFTINTDAQEDYDALKADIHASEEQRQEALDSTAIPVEQFDDAFNRLYPPVPGSLTTSAPDDIFDRFYDLREKYLRSVGDDKASIASELISLLSEPAPMSVPASEAEASVQDRYHIYSDDELRMIDEDTPLGWRTRLKNIIKEKLGTAKEKAGRWTNAKEGLLRRSAELDTEAQKISGFEKVFRNVGKKYEALPMWQKVALGGSLAVGYGLTIPISSWLAGAYAIPLVATRVAAMMGSFERNKKLLDSISKHEASGSLAETKLYRWLGSGSETSRENKAMAKALLTSFGMTGAMAGVAHELAQHHVAERIGQWIAEHIPQSEAVKSAPPPERPPVGTASAPATAASSPVGPVPGPAPEGAAPGEGASAPAAPASAPGETAPIAAPAEVQPVPSQDVAVAGADTTASQTHEAAPVPGAEPAIPPEAMQIDVAASKGHGYEYMMKRLWEQLQDRHIALPDGAANSDLKDLLKADKSTIDKVVHNLALENKFVNADGTSVQIDPDTHLSIDKNGNLFIQGGHNFAEGGNLAPSDADVTPAYHPEAAHVYGASEGITEKTIEVPVPQDVPFAHPDFPVTDADTAITTPPTPETSQFDTQAAASDLIVNAHNVTVMLGEPHIYEAGKDVIIYGGVTKDQAPALLKYLSAHPQETVFSGDEAGKYRVPWKLVEGKLVSGEPVKTTGILGIFQRFATPPGPEEFTKVVQ